MTPLSPAIVIMAMVCLTTLLLTLAGMRYYSLQHARRRAHDLEIVRIKETTAQSLSLDQTRRSEIELEMERLNADDTEMLK